MASKPRPDVSGGSTKQLTIDLYPPPYLVESCVALTRSRDEQLYHKTYTHKMSSVIPQQHWQR